MNYYGFESYHIQRKPVKEIKTYEALIILIKIFTLFGKNVLPGFLKGELTFRHLKDRQCYTEHRLVLG
jgi:hypothetical protein